MWRVTSDAAFGLNGSMFVNKRTLFVCVTLDTSRVGAGRQSRLFQLKTTVGIVAIAALHCTFQHLVMERQVELVLCLTVTAQAELRFAALKQLQTGQAGLLRVCF